MNVEEGDAHGFPTVAYRKHRILPNYLYTDHSIHSIQVPSDSHPKILSKWIFFNCSIFSDVFDEFHFIRSLQGDVRIVKELPKELESVPRARKHFTSWAGMSYYEEMMDLWKNYQVHHLH